MLGRNYYHRSFIILQAKDSGFGISGTKEPAGYCKLEIKRDRGRMSLYVQDLKPASSMDGIYDIYFISTNRGIEPQKLTSIEVDDGGHGEAELDFYTNNVLGSGYSLEQFHALAVVFRPFKPSMGSAIRFPLTGYANKKVEVDWAGRVKESFRKIINVKQTGDEVDEVSSLETPMEDEASKKDEAFVEGEVSEEAAEIEEAEPEIKGEALIQEKTVVEGKNEIEEAGAEEEAAEIAEKADEMSDRMDEFDLIHQAERLPQDMVGVIDQEAAYEESMFADDEEKAEEDREEVLNTMEDEVPHTAVDEGLKMAEESLKREEDIAGADRNNDYWSKVKSYFDTLFRTHKLVNPFDEDMGESEWIQVQQMGHGYMNSPYIGAQYGYCYSGFTCGNHYLVGLVKKQGRVCNVVYGVPGYCNALPPMGMYGFSRWVPSKNGYGMGYWLIYIDAVTGYVVYP